MKRRDSVLALLAIAAAGDPLPALAQEPRAPLRIALLPDFKGPWESWLKIVQDGLRELGRIEGRDYVLYRSGVFYEDDAALAVDRALQARPDLILVVNLGYAVAAHKRDTTTPMVMMVSGLPVEAGVAHSLARPGKNVTGMAIYGGSEVFGKLVQLIHEVKPGVKRIGAIHSYVPPFHPRAETDVIVRQLQGAAGALGVDLRVYEISKPEQVDAALASASAHGVEALVLTSGQSIQTRRKDLLQYAAARRLPTIADSSGMWSAMEQQPLLVYAASFPTLMRRVAPYVNQILWHGVKPGDLPIQLPARFEFWVNLKTAKTISLAVPPSILVRADRVIE